MMARRWIVFLLTAAGAAGLLALREASQAEARPPVGPPPGRAPITAPVFTGVAGCSARDCHGRSTPVEGQRVRLNEFSLVLAHDRHLHAYQALLSERGKRMAENLGIAKAHEDARCLACHSIPQLAAASPSATVLALRQDGVSCEACHGPAGKPETPWLYAHTGESWKKRSPAEKEQSGMTALTDLKVQARVCAGCHVGAPAANGVPARDCNHDMMAAGHPRLNFELSAFRANLPPHWNVDDRKKRDPMSEARAWAIGQVASAKASLDLLADRASRADKAPWPEFAEYGCYSCHAGLRHPSWRQTVRGFGKRRPGSLLYNTWYSAALPAVAVHTPPADGDVPAAFVSLGLAMSQGSPAAEKIADQARQASKQLELWLGQLDGAGFSQESVRKMRQALVPQDVTAEKRNWDDVEQIALGAAALSQALDEPPLRESLGKLFEVLAFPESYESPHGYPHVKGLDEALKQVVAQLHR
jgi:hypothetical protein